MMKLTDEQQAILNGSKGETMAKVMKTQVMFGEAFGAEKMVPVTSEYNHLVTSFGLKLLAPVYELMDKLLEAGAPSQQKFSVDPRPMDPNVPANFLQKLIFKKFMYSKQDFYEEQLDKLGLKTATRPRGELQSRHTTATTRTAARSPMTALARSATWPRFWMRTRKRTVTANELPAPAMSRR